jgi:GxxExxY protein
MVATMDATSPGLLFESEVFQIQGAIFAVYRKMGAGFLEGVYQECLTIEFGRRSVPFAALQPLSIVYDGQLLRHNYVADFVCFGSILIELKAVRALAPEHRAQTINYLRATNLKLGLLVNFGATPKVQIERFAL